MAALFKSLVGVAALTAAANTCTPPTSESDGPAYISCLEKACQDMDDSVVSTMSGGTVSSCSAVVSMLGCDTDLSTVLSIMPEGSMVEKICSASCGRVCDGNAVDKEDTVPSTGDTVDKEDTVPSTCTPPTSESDGPAYISCLEKACQDMDDSVVSTMSGGTVSSCSAVVSMFGCDTDLSTVLSIMPEGSMVEKICSTSCGRVCDGNAVDWSCRDIADEYEKQGCCGNPAKVFDSFGMPKDVVQRIAEDGLVFCSHVKSWYKQSKCCTML